jgi:diguanylate cyclase (GGDEF)-like protein
MNSIKNSAEAKRLMLVWRGKNQDAFLRAQHSAISRLIPVLYAVVALATIALSISYSSTAPLWISVGVPTVMLIPIGLRLRYWLGISGTSDSMPIAKVRRDIKQTNFIGPIIALIFTGAGVVLLSHGTQHHHEIAGIAIWILAITSAFCLAATPFASISILLAAATPLTFSLIMDNNHIIQTMGGIVVLISAQVTYMLLQNYLAFFEMVHSKSELQARKEIAEIAEKQSSVLANTDHLTGLPNRRKFERMLLEYSDRSDLADIGFAVGILDLDGFKPVNDVYGHNAGDEVLIEVAKRLEIHLSHSCDIARLGGDEFAFITPLVAEADLICLSETIQTALNAPYTVHPDRLVRIASSIGIAVKNHKQPDPLHLIAQAGIALYHAKANGKGISTLFTQSMELANLERAQIEQGLRQAISNDELDVHFQPIYEISTRRLAGFEALARWKDAELGSISPAIFVPIAEESGLIGTLTELVLRKAATAAAAWPSNVYLSFNVSAEQLMRESAGLRFVTVLGECGLPPARLEIEVTETAIMKDLPAALRTLENLKAAGARISLDDFGTGFSSLSQIRNLPLNKVKIDKSFIDGIVLDAKTRSLVETIVTMCQALNIECTAEGVEQPEQLAELSRIGCHSAQGYLLSRPLTLKAAQRLINQAYPVAFIETKRSA